MTGSRKITEDEIAALAARANAPQSLHRRVQEMVDEVAPARTRRRSSPGGVRGRAGFALGAAGAALAAAAAVLALVLLSASGGGSGLTVQRTVALTLSRPTMGAPAENTAHRSELAVSVEGVAFPYWRERFGWRSAGQRVDRIAGRTVTTVFYADSAGRRVGYAIVSGRALPTQGGEVRWQGKVPYRVLEQGGASVVAWPRGGHLCVVSGRGVDSATLLRLAGWRSGDTPA